MESAVAFVSLFLGLVLGPQVVEVAVAENVARVEIRIDGELCAEMIEPPWRSSCDMGRRLSPRHLEAIGFGQSGEEVGRAELWLNLPRPAADARLVLLDYRDGRPHSGRVTWSSVTGEPPLAIKVLFDGRELLSEILEADAADEDGSAPVSSSTRSDSRRFELPEHDMDQLHFLRVELEFVDDVSASAELTFGGFYADRVNTELTALPVELPSRRARLPELDELQDWIEGPEDPLPVVATEKGQADVVFVLGGTAPGVLTRLMLELRPAARIATLSLRKDERLFIGSPWPVVKGAESGQPYGLFPFTRGLTRREGGYLWLLSRVRMRRGKVEDQRLADAVAVAGMTASSRNRRRVAVLLLGPDDGQYASQLSPEQVRGYLEDLDVPLRVWSLGGDHPEWGEVTDVSSLPLFRNAVSALEKALERQRILWVAGTHLPQSLRLAGDIGGVTRAR